MKPTKKCIIDECRKGQYSRGWCQAHYQRWYRHGDPLGGLAIPESPEHAFTQRLTQNNECIEWTGGQNGNGYGRFWVAGEMIYTHRFAWERVNGPIPSELVIDHICHNRLCCNVDHLRLVTPRENTWNRSGPVGDTASGVRNVTRMRDGWQVNITKDGESLCFGTYPTIEDAAIVAEQKRKELFGEYAGKG